MKRDDGRREQTASEEGVTVKQQYTDGTFDLPSVVFTVDSERPERVLVRLIVRDIEASAVGFHPEFESDAWSIEAGDLVFERIVESHATVQTLYALDTDDLSVFEQAMDSLEIERVHPPEGADSPGSALDVGFDDDPSPGGATGDDGPGEPSGPADAVARADDGRGAGTDGPDGSDPAEEATGIEVTDGTVPDADPDTADAPGSAADESEASPEVDVTGPDGPEQVGGSDTHDTTRDARTTDRAGADEPEQVGGSDTHDTTRDARTTDRAGADDPGDGASERQAPARRGPGSDAGEHDSEQADADGPGKSPGRADRGVDPATAGVGITDGGATAPRDPVGTGKPPAAGGGTGPDDADRSADVLDGQSTGDLVEELLDRFDEGDVSLAHRERLQVVGMGPEADAAQEARMTDLQTRVSDVEAFTGPLEQLFERYGSPLAAFESFDERLRAIEERFEEVGRLDERVDDTADRLETTADRFDARLDALEGDIDEIQSAVAEIEQLRADVDATGEQADDVAADLSTVEDRLSALDDRVRALSGDRDSMEADIAELRAWREDLASTLEALVGE